MPLEWFIALRFLKQGRMQTLLIIAGVGVGVGALLAPYTTRKMKKARTSESLKNPAEPTIGTWRNLQPPDTQTLNLQSRVLPMKRRD